MKVLKLLQLLISYILVFNCNSLQAQIPYDIDFSLFKTGFDSPIDIAHANDDRLFIVERSGRIKIIHANGNIQLISFLDIDNRVHNTGNQSEQGLLGLTFHPEYQNNGYFYVHYIANNDDSIISRFSVSSVNPDMADANSELILMTIEQPYTNHNGGTLKFGPDGYLYIGMGDGGSANDPGNRAQDRQSYHGKMLRIDVDNGNPYAIPPDNPFVNNANTLDEIYALGLRNPWKFSFDRATGDMWIGDVGQGTWEEIDFISHLSNGGENFGWRCKEGNHDFNTQGCNGTYIPPIAEYNHEGFFHCSVTGGYVYRGPVSGMADFGVYFYTDYCSGRLWGTWFSGNPAINVNTQIFGEFGGNNFVSFGEDQAGNLYASTLSGQIHKMEFTCKTGLQCPLSVIIVEQENATCHGAFDGYAQVEVQDGTPPYNYEWPNGENSPALANLGAFTYVVTVTDASNNTGTASVTIEQPNPIQINIEEQFDVTCTDDGGVMISINGDFPPYEVDWSNGSFTMQNFGLTDPGTYTVTVTDNNDCTSSLDVEIEGDLDGPDFSIAGLFVVDCLGPCTLINADISQAPTNFTYEWLDAFNNTITNTETEIEICEPGEYTFVMSDLDSGCSSIETVTIDDNFWIPNINVTNGSATLTCLNPMANLSIEPLNQNLTYSWFDPSGNEISQSTTATGNMPGVYNLITTGSNGCTLETTFVVDENINVPSVVAMAEGILTCINTSVVITAFSTTEAPLSFQWSTMNGNIISGANEGVAEVDQPGIYKLVVTNLENGCTVETTVIVDEDTNIPQVSINAPSLTLNCDQNGIDISGVSPASDLVFLWSDMQGNIISDDISITIIQAGTYTLTATNTINGCESSESITINDAEGPDLSLQNTSLILTCINPFISITALTTSTSQNLIFEWTGPNGFYTQGMTTTIVEEGSYTVTLTDTQTTCSSEITFVVTSDGGEPEFELVSSGDLNCIFSEVTLSTDPDPTFTLIWTGPSGFTSNQGTITISQAGTYCAEGVNDLTGCSTIKCIDVIEDNFPPLPDVFYEIPGPVNCNGDLVAVNFDVFYSELLEDIPHTYEWTTTDGNIVSGQTSSEINIDAPGNYCLMITIPGNGCVSVNCVTVQGAESPSLELNSNAPLCFGEASVGITSNVSAGMPPYTYLWSTGAITEDLFGIQSGSYSLTVTDANACTVEQSVTIIEPTPITINLDTNDETSAGANNGSVVSTVMGGTPPYQYVWSNGEMTESIFGLAPGNYSLTVSDANGCNSTSQATVANFGCALDFELLITEATCFEDPNGAIDLIINAGTAPFDFSWSNDATTEDITGLLAGTYSVTVIDADNCEQISTVIVSEPLELTGTIQVDGVLTCTNDQVSLTCTVVGGTPPYTYTWSDGATATTTIANGPETFTCLVIDANGCSLELSVAVTSEISYPLGVACLPDTLICDYEIGSSYGAAYDLGDGFTYQWLSPNGSTENNTILVWEDAFECGDYTFSITNEGTGCSSKITYHFACPNIWYEIAEVPSQIALGCSNPTQLIDLEIFPIEFETFEWKDPSGNVIGTMPDVEVSDCGIHTFTIFSPDYPCPAVFEVEVICDFQEPVSDAGESQNLDCVQTEVEIGGQATSMGPEFVYEWSDDSGNVIGDEAMVEVNECGVFTLVVTNSNNGCTVSSAVIVECEQEIPTANAGEDLVLNCDVDNVILQAEESSTGSEFTYTWTDDSGDVVGIGQMVPVEICNLYTLTVTNTLNGCTASDEVEVLCDIDLPIAQAQFVQDANCEFLYLLGNGSSEGDEFEYVWTDENGNIISTNLDAFPTQDGIYTLTVTNTLTSCSNATTVEVIDQSFSAQVSIEPNCEDIILEVTIDGEISDYTFDWSNGQTTTVVNYLYGWSEYMVSIYNPTTGCNLLLVGELPENSGTVLAVAQLSDLIMDCKNTYLSGVGSSEGDQFEYEWTDANGNVISTELSPTVEGFGEFTLTVTDTSTGCQTSASVISPDITISSAAIIVDAADVNNGSIDITVSGGSTPYTYEWSNGEVTEDIDGLSAGDYTVTVTDANGCEHVSTFVVEIVNAISIADELSPIKIYPNPSSGLLNVNSEIIGFDMTIVDLFGKVVYQKNNLSKTESINLDLLDGVYFVKLKQKDQGQYIAKLILHKK